MSVFKLDRWFDPITRKRLQRFREFRRAWYAFWILLVLYVLSLGSELISNDKPLFIHFNNEFYFPVFFFYPEHTFTGSGQYTRPDYKAINLSDNFANNENNYMLFPIIPYGPQEVIKPASLEVSDEVQVSLNQEPHIATINIDTDYLIKRAQRAYWFFDTESVRGINFRQHYSISEGFSAAITARFNNQHSPSYEELITSDNRTILAKLTPYKPRSRAPRTVRVRLQETDSAPLSLTVTIQPDANSINFNAPIWDAFTPEQRKQVLERAQQRISGIVEPLRIQHNDATYRFDFKKEDVLYPFRPVAGHPFGIDNAGRDVLSRILYGLRISLNFGLLLVVVAMVLGALAGAIQGYYAGKVDLFAQRFTEIWESLPFLYVLILLGSIYGQSFTLLILIYGIFNWVGISYYMRAEFLRLRNQPFVEAARCLGISDRKIVLRHILPNALVPIITFFPFSLVGAIGTLAALDYLGFGLPPPTPSWGELLAQGQEQPRWWLIFYPTSALFIVMLLGVFIGEGIRSAFDPRKFTRLE